ncbi:MAG TPA: PA2778 family cysteine peptidase [Rhodocyclaceae bacterium]|nr:PA2778 family cysteine peptidase [Rhodocyclaceae bacterium]
MLAAAALCLPLAGASGCAVQTRRIAATPPPGLPRRVEHAGTPFFADDDYYCGPAALATVLTAAGSAVRPQALIGDVFVPGRKGSLQLEMLAGARRHGAVATPIPGTLEALLREIAAGNAVVVLQNLGLTWAPSWHYAVAIGYDLDAGHVLLRSGPIARQALALRTFEHTWARGGHWAFVALPPGRLPATADEPEATRALVAFERSADPQAAVRAYAAALARWPHSLTLAMGLGNAHYAAGEHAAAEQVFRAAAHRHDAPAAYNNLAVLLFERGEREAASLAARHALRQGGPHAGAARKTLEMIESATPAR